MPRVQITIFKAYWNVYDSNLLLICPLASERGTCSDNVAIPSLLFPISNDYKYHVGKYIMRQNDLTPHSFLVGLILENILIPSFTMFLAHTAHQLEQYNTTIEHWLLLLTDSKVQ